MQAVVWFQKGTEALVAGARAYLRSNQLNKPPAGKKPPVPETDPAPPMYAAVNLFE